MVCDPDKTADLLEPHLSALWRAAYRLCRNAADAEDLVQDTCLKAHRALLEGQAVETPRPWLLRIQHNAYLDRLRRDAGKHTEPFDDSDPRHTDKVVDLVRTTATAERLSALEIAWSELNEEQRAILAYYAEGYRLTEISEITDLPLTALKARMHRARVRLGRLMRDLERSAPAGAATGEAK